MRFILASESARRIDLLSSAGFDFEARKSGFPEETFHDPRETVEYNARGKALAVAADTDAVVLGSDTVVYLPGSLPGEAIFGQAANTEDVGRMLAALSGRAHEVYSGVAVARSGEIIVRHAVTTVRMRPLSDAEIAAYAASGDGIGKAGGYAIQGRAAMFVEWIGGDYTNVVGLPLALTTRMLEGFSIRWYES